MRGAVLRAAGPPAVGPGELFSSGKKLMGCIYGSTWPVVRSVIRY